MAEWGYVAAGYGLLVSASVAYVVSLHRRAGALRRRSSSPDEAE